jgi:hypothetical protein
MTSQKQTFLFTEEQLTSSPEAFPVSHTAQQESDSEKKMSATCGQKCLEQFEKFNHVGLWGKTFSALLIGMEGWYSKRCKLIWKLKGTKSNRMYFQLRPLTLPTEGIGFGLLPTVAAMDANGIKNIRKDSNILHGGRHSVSLTHMFHLKMLPTPTATDWKGAYPPSSINNHPARKNMMRNAYQLTKEDYNSKTSQLSPQFVLEMMGFPTNWTLLPFLNGEQNQSKQEETQ